MQLWCQLVGQLLPPIGPAAQVRTLLQEQPTNLHMAAFCSLFTSTHMRATHTHTHTLVIHRKALGCYSSSFSAGYVQKIIIHLTVAIFLIDVETCSLNTQYIVSSYAAAPSLLSNFTTTRTFINNTPPCAEGRRRHRRTESGRRRAAAAAEPPVGDRSRPPGGGAWLRLASEGKGRRHSPGGRRTRGGDRCDWRSAEEQLW